MSHAQWLRLKLHLIRYGAGRFFCQLVLGFRKTNHKQVVFVTNKPRAREAKLASALQAAGWEVILFYSIPGSFEKKYWDRAYEYKTPAQALFLCTLYKPVAFHVFCLWSYDVAELLLKFRPGKIVIDAVDVLNTYSESAPIPKGALSQERYCLENADGICARSLETQMLKRKFKTKFRGKRILFLDYCWANEVSLVENSKPDKRPPSFIFAGGVPIHRGKPDFQIFFETISELVRRGAELCIYVLHENPGGLSFEEAYEPYIELARKAAGRFRVCKPIPFYLLIEEMKKFDAGWAAEMNFRASENRLFPSQGYYGYRYSSSNRIFEYLDAGLPVVTNSPYFMEWMVRRMKCWIDPEGFVYETSKGQPLPEVDYATLRLNAFKAAQRLSVFKQVPRLENFYHAL